MTIDELQWMTELFKTGNMSKAAENLYVTQPALSQCVQRIEKQLGFKLFERSNKGINPTQKGQLFYDAAVNITNTYQQFLVQADLLNQMELKEITIGLAPYLSYSCSAGIVRELNARFPSIKVHIYEAITSELIAALKENRIQMIVINDAGRKSQFKTYPFGSYATCIFLRKGSSAAEFAYEKNGHWYLDPIHLAEEPLCATRPGAASRHAAEEILEEAHLKPSFVAESGHLTTLYRYAAEGLASAISPMTGEVFELDQQQTETLVYRIPTTYKHHHVSYSICVMPEIDKLISREIYAIISDVILKNKNFRFEVYREE